MDMLKTVVKEWIQPSLKSHKFKKRGLRWNRDRGCFVDVVSVQKATYSTEQAVVFTINLGVFVPSFYEAVWGTAFSGFAMEADCAVQLRLGELMEGKLYGGALDRWWTVSDPVSVESAGSEIRKAFEEELIPFFASLDTFEAIADHMRQITGWQAKIQLITIYRALAEWKSGSTSLALEMLNSMKGKAWESKASAVAEIIKSEDKSEERKLKKQG